MPIPVHTFLIINGSFATSSSIILNLLLAWLVVKYTPIQMQGYSRLMLMHGFADVLYDVVNFTIGPVSCFLWVWENSAINFAVADKKSQICSTDF